MANITTGFSINPPKTVLLDEVDGNTTYLGVAKMGSATSDAVWQIRKLSKVGTVTSFKFASGSDRYNQIWDNRTGLTYT